MKPSPATGRHNHSGAKPRSFYVDRNDARGGLVVKFQCLDPARK